MNPAGRSGARRRILLRLWAHLPNRHLQPFMGHCERPAPKPGDQPGLRALTLLELIVTVSIILMVLTLVVPISSKFKKRAEKVKCMSHMRTLHTCFVAYVNDKGEWPQLPIEEEDHWTEDKFYRFWVNSLEPYGASEETWLCPSDNLLLQMKKSELEKKDRFFGTYVPTPFDTGAGTPFRWNQPWVIERGDFHGRGSHMLMPDGSVQDSQNPFYGR